MLPLNNDILLRSINTRQLVQNAIRVKKIFKIKFSPIITSNGLNGFVELSFDYIRKFWD